MSPATWQPKKEKEILKVYPHNGGGREEIAMDEVPLSMLIPILVMAVGILLLGIFSIKIISTVIQFAIPSGI